jgi:hypothetical protein
MKLYLKSLIQFYVTAKEFNNTLILSVDEEIVFFPFETSILAPRALLTRGRDKGVRRAMDTRMLKPREKLM